MKRQDILPLSLDGMPVYSRCPPLPHISSVFPDSSQVAINSPEWRGTGWEQSAFLKNITKRVRILTFRSRVQSPESGVRSSGSGVRGPESGVRSPGSGVQGPESGVQSPDMSQLISLWNRWTLLRWSKQTKVYLIPLTLILGTGLTLRRLGNFKGTRNLWVGQSLNLFPLGLMGSCYPSGKFWNFWKTALC